VIVILNHMESNLFEIIVNAASKGHLPVVFYLLAKQSANPLSRNNWGETAYDVAAAVFEVWICEVSNI
jgi:ankyrin repeat protein